MPEPKELTCPRCGKMTLDYNERGFSYRCLRRDCMWAGDIAKTVTDKPPLLSAEEITYQIKYVMEHNHLPLEVTVNALCESVAEAQRESDIKFYEYEIERAVNNALNNMLKKYDTEIIPACIAKIIAEIEKFHIANCHRTINRYQCDGCDTGDVICQWQSLKQRIQGDSK